ncbi:MAG: DUF2279 domain-containing protein [Candidatus Omnitrophica bacterium]|nr:DUF2279 domain-containing protein [Candidatus Omnitrophota bacterium]
MNSFVGQRLILAVLLFVLSATLFPEPVRADSWTGPDKGKHVIVSCGISILAYNIFLKNTAWSESQAQAAAFAAAMAVGTAKECYDKYVRETEFSWKDMAANAAGAGIGITLKLEF